MVPGLLVSCERSAFIPIGVNFPLLENQRYSFGDLTVVFNSLASCCPRGSFENLFIHLNALLNTYLI